MMEKTFWGLLWSSFKETQGCFSMILAVVLPFVLLRVTPTSTVSLTLALPIAIVFVVVIAALANAAYESFQMSRRILPRIVYATKPHSQIVRATALCLLEPSELFSHDTVVSFYYIGHEGFEQLIGIGAVVNIQEDGRILVELDYPSEGHEETVNKLAQNDSEVLNKTRVKPSVPKTAFGVLFRGG